LITIKISADNIKTACHVAWVTNNIAKQTKNVRHQTEYIMTHVKADVLRFNIFDVNKKNVFIHPGLCHQEPTYLFTFTFQCSQQTRYKMFMLHQSFSRVNFVHYMYCLLVDV